MTVYEIQLELRKKAQEFRSKKVSKRIINQLNVAVSALTCALNMMEHEPEKVEPGIYG